MLSYDVLYPIIQLLANHPHCLCKNRKGHCTCIINRIQGFFPPPYVFHRSKVGSPLILQRSHHLSWKNFQRSHHLFSHFPKCLFKNNIHHFTNRKPSFEWKKAKVGSHFGLEISKVYVPFLSFSKTRWLIGHPTFFRWKTRGGERILEAQQ